MIGIGQQRPEHTVHPGADPDRLLGKQGHFITLTCEPGGCGEVVPGAWNERKKQFSHEQVALAYGRLAEQGWLLA
jgi:hypothetical protein